MNSKMQKVKNFNQILLAIAGIIGILFLTAISIIFVIDMWPRDYNEEGMISTEEVDNLNEHGLRKEIISFENFQIADSVNQIFILPVTQASLDNAESLDKSLGLMNSFSGGYYGELIYNNIVVHYAKEDSTVIVFKSRLSIGDYMITKRNEHKFLLATGCEADTNNDNFLNSKDIQNLYVYDLKRKRFKQIKTPSNYTTIRTYEPDKTNIIICQFGVDRNENGIFEDNIEPTVYMKLNTAKLTIEPFAKKAIIESLQRILEGK